MTSFLAHETVRRIAATFGVLASLALAYFYVLYPLLTVPGSARFAFYGAWILLVVLAVKWWRHHPWRAFAVPVVGLVAVLAALWLGGEYLGLGALRVPLILDVDTGIDDALALLYACASPEADLLAVTCVGGNVDARQVAENTRAVLELVGRTDVPVVLGREQPLVKALETTPETHGPNGIGYAVLPPPSRALEADEAADRIIALARSRPGEITLVTLGPLTNLAVALEREPSLPSLLRAVFVMGGAYRAPGNTTPTTEWNMHVDPDAAKAVFAAWRPAGADAGGAGAPAGDGEADGVDPSPKCRLVAMGLDVTERAVLLPAHLGAMARRAGAELHDAGAMASEPGRLLGSVATQPVLRFLGDALRFYFEFHDRYDGFHGAFIHDPFVVAAAIDPSLIRTQPVSVDVEAGPGLAHGMTVADWRGITGNAANVEVAVEGDATAFLDRFVERVGGLAAARAAMAR